MTKTIFITGTSSGIGKATVELFAKQGWNVIATVKNTYIHSNLFKDLPNVTVYELDVTNYDQVDWLAVIFRRFFQKLGKLIDR